MLYLGHGNKATDATVTLLKLLSASLPFDDRAAIYAEMDEEGDFTGESPARFGNSFYSTDNWDYFSNCAYVREWLKTHNQDVYALIEHINYLSLKR